MWTFPAAEDAGPCLKLSIELMENWVRVGVTPREIGFIQKYLVRSHAFDVDTAAKRLHQGLDVELLSLPPDYFSAWIDRVNGVTAESGNDAVRQRIDPGRLLVVVVGTATQVMGPLRSALPDLEEASVVPFDAE
jgi:zinc protease